MGMELPNGSSSPAGSHSTLRALTTDCFCLRIRNLRKLTIKRVVNFLLSVTITLFPKLIDDPIILYYFILLFLLIYAAFN